MLALTIKHSHILLSKAQKVLTQLFIHAPSYVASGHPGPPRRLNVTSHTKPQAIMGATYMRISMAQEVLTQLSSTLQATSLDLWLYKPQAMGATHQHGSL